MRNLLAFMAAVVLTAGRELDRYVVWDYVSRRKSIIA